jgi:hypothetical protein
VNEDSRGHADPLGKRQNARGFIQAITRAKPVQQALECQSQARTT